MRFIDVWITCPSAEVAEEIASRLVDERLAACANVFGDVQSVYRWQGRIEKEREVALLVKTREEFFDDLAARVESLHPYDVPAVIGVPVVCVNKGYGEWLGESTER